MKVPMQHGLCALMLSIAALLPIARAAPRSSTTQDYFYEFNAVAITGSGYITGIIPHPTAKDVIYVRTDIGSSYRWNPILNKWIPLTDFVSAADSNLLGTESIALDPSHPERLYLAQGRYTTSDNAAFFVSDDYGETFDIYTSPFVLGSNELGRNNGERLVVNPFNTDELWMGTRTEGLWKSTDRAQTWTNVTSFPNAFANGIGIVSVIFDSKSEGTMYAAATAPEGLYYSTDHGSTWAALAGQPSSWKGTYIYENETAPQSTAPQPMKMALASNGVLYVTYGDAPGPYGVDYGVVYSYNTKTKHWTNITPNTDNVTPALYTPQAFPGGGFCGLSLDASDPDTLVVVSLDRDPGPALDSMYLSRDGGSSWTDVTQLSTPNREDVGGYWGHPYSEAALDNGTTIPWLNFDWSPLWSGYGAPSPIHGLCKFGWWMSAVMLSPWDSNTVLYGTGATIWATDDLLSATESSSAAHWFIQAQGIEESAVLALSSPTKGPHLFSGLGDINGFRHDDLNVPQPMFGLPVFSNLNSIDWAGQNQSTVVRVGNNGLVNTAESGCHQAAYSLDGGVDWTTFPNCISGINSSSSDSGIIAIDASGTHLIWSSTSTALEGSSTDVTTISGPYYSSDMGASWSSPTGLTLMTPNISADRVEPRTFYSYTSGRWYVSRDGGASYTSTSGAAIGLPADTSTGAVPVVDFAAAGHVYLPLAHGIYHTSDYGTSWARLTSTGVEPALFSVGAAAPGFSQPALFLWGTVSDGGVVGLYRSDDHGASWVRVNDDSHQYGGPSLIQGDPRVFGRVYIGNAGRGIVYADIVSGLAGYGNVAGTGGI